MSEPVPGPEERPEWLRFCKDPERTFIRFQAGQTRARLGLLMSRETVPDERGPRPLSICQRAFLRDVVKGPIVRDEWGFGIHRPATVHSCVALGLVDVAWVDAQVEDAVSSVRLERAAVTPAGLAVFATLPELTMP